MQHEILLGLTTTPKSDWRGKVEEMKKFGIKKIALFPTFLEIAQRKELYELLEEIEGLEIPHVHLREEDMEAWEMQWFESKGAKAYNIHMRSRSNASLLKYTNMIFVENHPHEIIPEHILQNYAGICLDFQHWELSLKKVSKKTELQAEKFKIGCCHMSAMPKWKNVLKRFVGKFDGSGHYMLSLDEMDYLKKYKEYFPKYMSIELENSFEEQLKIKKYLEEKLKLHA